MYLAYNRTSNPNEYASYGNAGNRGTSLESPRDYHHACFCFSDCNSSNCNAHHG